MSDRETFPLSPRSHYSAIVRIFEDVLSLIQNKWVSSHNLERTLTVCISLEHISRPNVPKQIIIIIIFIIILP